MPVNVFEPTINSIAGESFRCISLTPEAYAMEWIVQPGGYVPFEHTHEKQEEVFRVQEGEIRLVLEGRELIARAGQTITVPKGKPHIAYNNTDGVLRCEVSYAPALDYERFSQCFCGLMQDGFLDDKGGISIPMMGYMITRMKCQALSRPTNIPALFFRMALRFFYLMGVLRGWGKLYTKYTGQR